MGIDAKPCVGCVHYYINVCRAGHAEIMRRIQREGGECPFFKPAENEGEEHKAATDRLVALARGRIVELFRDERADAFAALDAGGHVEVHPIKGGHFGSWLRRLYFEAEGKAVRAEVLRDAVATLESEALFGEGSKIRRLENRVAWHEGRIYYDMTDERWRAVEIDAGGWRIVDRPPILFRRFQHQVRQVEPEGGGDLDDIFNFVNIADEDDRLILKCQLVASLIPGIPHPILVLMGPQGCGKTAAHKILRSLVDPSSIPVLSFSHDPEEMALLLHQHYCPYFDNVSKLQPWISDILCRACTGDGFTKRKLYTDEDAVILSFKRCVGLNGIAMPLDRPDLLDRCLIFNLRQIERTKRKEEAELLAEFDRLKPKILGAMFDILSKAMRIYPTVQVKPLPRMADFARWGEAIAQAMGYEPGQFINAYRRKLGEQTEEVLVAHPLGLAVLSLMELRDEWRGKPTKLLNEVNAIAAKQNLDVKSEYWPKNASWLTRRLKEIETILEQEGIKIDYGHGKERIITLSKVKAELGEGAPPASPRSTDFAVDGVVPSLEEAEGVKSSKGGRITADGKADGKSDGVEMPSVPKTPSNSEIRGSADTTTPSTAKSGTLGDEAKGKVRDLACIVSAVWDLILQLAPKRGDLVDKRRLKELAERRGISTDLVDRILEREARDGRIIDRGAAIEPIR
jgi:hypothetical protein